MLLFLVTCVSLAFLHLSLWCSSSLISSSITPRNRGKEKLEEEQSSMLLDLPELALECILERLPPAGLRSMAGVCTSLRERCLSDRLWETHFNLKWGSLMGPAARVHWLSHNHHRNHSSGNHRWLIHLLSHLLPPPLRRISSSDYNSSSPIMSWYLALETGSFSFPAQVFNRENGHAGFLLSCYDAELIYDSPTHTFHARYPPHGKRAIAVESGVPWERLRAPPVHTSAHDLHISDCLNDLRPGDHIEIQWRRNKDFPYGWWYGVVGHLESCDGSESYCRCPNCAAFYRLIMLRFFNFVRIPINLAPERRSIKARVSCEFAKYVDVVVLEFNQYSQGSRWRRTTINRKEHREEGNQADGFYGGIRKLRSSDEISRWKQLWPSEMLV